MRSASSLCPGHHRSTGRWASTSRASCAAMAGWTGLLEEDVGWDCNRRRSSTQLANIDPPEGGFNADLEMICLNDIGYAGRPVSHDIAAPLMAEAVEHDARAGGGADLFSQHLPAIIAVRCIGIGIFGLFPTEIEIIAREGGSVG